jgi:hypothetical protein
LAVLRLMTNSKRDDCTTGRSAGFSPLSIRPAFQDKSRQLAEASPAQVALGDPETGKAAWVVTEHPRSFGSRVAIQSSPPDPSSFEARVATQPLDPDPSSQSRVAVQPSPSRSFEMKAEFWGPPKQVEPTAAPLGGTRTLTDNDTHIRRLAPAQIDAKEIADLLKRGRELVAAGDIPAARSVLKGAAEAGNASAAFELGATYDPSVLAKYPGTTTAPDIAMARAWYLTARELGSEAAAKQLQKLLKVDR